MDSGQIFGKYYSRLKKEGIIKALICASILGFAVNFVTAFVAWMTAFKGFWLPIVLGVAVIGVSAPLFYRKKFRPTAKQIARRIDRLGLQERLITMTELEKDESYIALRQREDAKEKLSAVDEKQIRFRFSAVAVTVASVLIILGVSMTTITTLSAQGILPDGSSWFEEVSPEPPVYFSVNYIAGEGGRIEGETEQTVEQGKSSQPVMAVAEMGWRFDGWSDGKTSPIRWEEDVRESVTITARFVVVDELAPEEDEGDSPGDEPVENKPASPGAGGIYEDFNQVIDGEINYKDVYEEYYRQVMEMLASGKDIPPELREIIEAYFDILL